MTFKQLGAALQTNRNLIIWTLPLVLVLCGLLVYRLGTLTPGLSSSELHAARAAVGWHGIFAQPFDLPLKLVRSVVFFIFPDHGQLLTRLPNALFGGLTVLAFASLVRLWHGNRAALLASVLFASSAWTLHVSRLASFDVMYLWALPTLLLTHMLLLKHNRRAAAWYGSLLVWGLLIYIPGMIWPVLLIVWLRRQAIRVGWEHFSLWWQRLLSVAVVLACLPLLIIDLTRSGQLVAWLGLPAHLAPAGTLARQFAGVPVHVFLRGPQYPELWLARAPLMDIFTLTACVLGIYFYVWHWQASRSRMLGALLVMSGVLVGLAGPVGLSLVVPLLYLAVATGIAYLSRLWLKVFPLNPLARGLGVGLIAAAVVLSCIYNGRAYFVAWPHTASTRSTFHYRP